ncbi:MAG TPA: hypothetical protein VJR89_16590, partial [Polyangiales bacterium]|nr:hypothetical protein [Polyangiales bacterium]
LYQVASVSSVKYARTDDAIVFSSRTGSYCGHPASESSAAYAAEVAAFTSGGDLDASVKLTTPTRGSSKGWRGNFARFAGDYDRETVEGDFLYTWQAGPLDGHARSLALDLQYNSATGTRTLQGFFAFGADIAGNDGSLLGMICNWAGPGNDHTPQRQFQSQVASMSAGASEFTLSASKLGYAPTNSCSSTTTEFDADLNQTIGSGEGVGTASMLDVPGASNTVEQELESRGFTLPVLY